VGTVEALALASRADASIALRPHESAPNVFYFQGDPATVARQFQGRDYTLLELSPSGRIRLREPGGGVIELLQLGSKAETLPSGLQLDAATRADLEAELIRLGEPEKTVRALGDDALVARHQEVQRGGLRGNVYPLAEKPVLDEAARMDMLKKLGEDYFLEAGPFKGTRFGTSRPEVSRLVVPLEGGGEVTVVVTVKLVEVRGGGAHGEHGGQGRVSVKRRSDGQWTADVEIDPRLSRENADSALRHEVGEAARVVRRFGNETKLKDAELRAGIEHEQSAGVMREATSSTEITAHAAEQVLEIGRMFERYEKDPSPENEALLKRMLARSGFQHRHMGKTARGDALHTYLHPDVAARLTVFIEGWATKIEVPVDLPGRPTRYSEWEAYTDALAKLRDATDAKTRTEQAAILDRIEALARAAYDRSTLTADALRAEGYPEAYIPNILSKAKAKGGNAYAHLFAELESLFALRADISGHPAYGMRVKIDAVQEVTKGGSIDEEPFGTVLDRVLKSKKRRPRDPNKPTDKPDYPRVTRKSGSQDERIRLTWVFDDFSTFNIDLPGKDAFEKKGGYGINKRLHGNFETARAQGPSLHLAETGITIPAESGPAHLVIKVDATLEAKMVEWGEDYSRSRFPQER
jgi:hypothetical protein